MTITPMLLELRVMRRWRSAVCLLIIVISGGVVVSSSPAQNEAKDRTDKAAQSPATRLPADQPALASSPASAPAATTTSAGQPDGAEMMKQMMELSKLNENHKLLAGLAGTWTYAVKMWMAPGAPPTESKGTAIWKSAMDGRFVTGEFVGQWQMPGPDGKLQSMTFKGMSIDGYDNVKKKFFSSWLDSMGTGIMVADGIYDPATKTFTYTAEYEPRPGMKTKVRELRKVIDNDHQQLEYYEDHGGHEVKTMEISYARKS